MANLTAAERAKRYRQRKLGNKVAVPPRLTRRGDIYSLWMLECMAGNQRSLRTFYRRRSTAVWFAQNTSDERLIERLTTAPEIATHMRDHMLISEWNDFLIRVGSLGITIDDERHPLDPDVSIASKDARRDRGRRAPAGESGSA